MRDLDRLCPWAMSSRVMFNRAKFQVLHLDHSNPMWWYGPGEGWLGSCQAEKAWGVLVSRQPNKSQQWAQGSARPVASWPASEITRPVGLEKGLPPHAIPSLVGKGDGQETLPEGGRD